MVRARLLIHFSNQSVNIHDLDSGGRGRKFAPRPAQPVDRRRRRGSAAAVPSSHPHQIQIKKSASSPARGSRFFCLNAGRDLELNIKFAPRSAQRSDKPSREAAGKSSHPDQYFPLQINSLQRPLVGHCLIAGPVCGSFLGNVGVTFAYVLSCIGHRPGH